MIMAKTGRRVLYQFPISHYCEKARWNLDAKGLAYEVVNLPPVVHVPYLRRFGGRTVPALHDGDVFLPDSRAIALHLDRAYPGRALLPGNEADRARALELADFFDGIGAHVRRFAYGHIIDVAPLFRARFFGGYGPVVRALAPVVQRPLGHLMKRMMRIDARGVEISRLRVEEGIDRLEKEIDLDPSRYLVGDALSIADITAASLFGPIVAAPGSPYEDTRGQPEALRKLRAPLLARPFGEWVEARYRADRRPRS